MKKLLSVIMICTATTAMAQNNAIFYGGTSDGHSSTSFLQNTANVNIGGTADGWGMGSYMQQTSNILLGGSGDGWMYGSFAQLVANINTGGQGDGWNSDIYAQQISTINRGGTGDGWTIMGYLQPTNNVFLGGAGDGWMTNKNILSYTGPYKGGEGDGWASTYNPVTPLPVTFLRFDAIKEGRVGILDWELAKDDEVIMFDVERSTNAISFTRIGTVAQNPEANKNYSFRDGKPVTGANYYRIKIYEKAGKPTYTPTRLLDFGDATAMDIKVYPVPATVSFNIEFPEAMVGKNAVMNIYAVNGAMIRQMKLMPLKASKIETNIADLADGNYLIHIAGSDGTMYTAKLIKMAR